MNQNAEKMRGIELLLNSNDKVISTRRPRMSKKLCFEFKNRTKIIDATIIRKIICFVNTIRKFYPTISCRIYFDLGDIVFKDKISCTILESICFILIDRFRYTVRVTYRILPNIESEGGRTSPLTLLRDGKKASCDEYIRQFCDSLYKNHYRKVVPAETNGPMLSYEMTNIESFLKYGGVGRKYAKELAKVIAELIGNANEHTCGDCLVDIDIANNYYNKSSHKKAIGVNVAVINYSPIKLGYYVRKRLFEDSNLPDPYFKVRDAYNFHKAFFDEKYTEEDFFNVASFQHRVSGDMKKFCTGGTGLTQLLHSLENYAEAHKCYFISGQRGLWFFQDEITTKGNRGVGFNKENDFFCHKPSENTIANCIINVPGTAYNLTFIFPESMEESYGDD